MFAVALGLLLRFYAYPKLAKVPLDVDNVSVAKGSGVTSVVVDEVGGVPTPQIRHGLDLTTTTYVSGDLTQPEVVEDGDVAVWVEAQRTVDHASGIVVGASLRALCLDRFSAEAVAPCSGQYISEEQGERVAEDPNSVQQPGLNFKFPFDTEKRGYQYYDLMLKGTVEARFEGEDTVEGVEVYRFVAESPPTSVGQQEVPGSLVGVDENSVMVDRFYSDRRTMWVEPVTGALLAVEDRGTQELLTPGEEPGEGTTVYEGTMNLDEETVAANVREAEDNVDRLTLLTTWPVVLWIVGGLLFIGVPLLLLSDRPARRRTK